MRQRCRRRDLHRLRGRKRVRQGKLEEQPWRLIRAASDSCFRRELTLMLGRRRPRRAVLLSSRLRFGEQIGRSNAERSRQCRQGGDGRSALGTLNPADVVAMNAALKAEALLGYPEFVA